MHKIGHCAEKMCGLNKQKLVAMATSFERSLPNFTAVICNRRATNPENWTKISHVHFEINGFKQIVKTGSSFGGWGHSRSLRMVPFDRSQHATSYSPFIATICLSHAVSEIWRDEKRCGLNKQKFIAMATSLERSQPNVIAIIAFTWGRTSACD